MKIKETTERECCEAKDMKKYRGSCATALMNPVFCTHCGQIWEHKRVGDEAGMDTKRIKVNPSQQGS